MLIFTRCWLATAIVLATSSAALAAPTEPGVSRDLALARAARVSDIRYRLSFTVKEHESAVAGSESVTFESRTAGDLPIDYRDGVIQSATLNDHPIATELTNVI
jgi:aminopeptidase N